MATHTGRSFRKGAIKSRSQTFNPKTKEFVERDAGTGRFLNAKRDGKPFKGIRREK